MLVKLKSGAFQGAVASGEKDVSLTRPAMLVYAGQFESADGPVEVTPEHVLRIVSAHNAMVVAKEAQYGGSMPLAECPPLQVDHSTSAHDTVGRLVGQVHAASHQMDDGRIVPAVYGNVCILGADNCERVSDGRWASLSLGFDLDTGSIAECTITPFPAARGASIKLTEKREENGGMDPAKLKAYLTGVKGMSDDDATAELFRLSSDAEGSAKLAAECDEHDAKLTAEKTEADAKEKEEHEAKLAAKKAAEVRLTAQRTELTTLSAGFATLATDSRKKMREGRILARLSKLRAAAKVTPAEIKKIDLVKLSAADDAAVELVLKTYEDREPVVMVGQLGSVKAVSLADLGKAKRATSLTQLEAETRANMSLLRKKGDAGAKTPARTHLAAPAVDPNGDAAFLEQEFGEVCTLMDGGRDDEAKLRIKSFMLKLMALGGAATEQAESEKEAADAEARLSAVAADLGKMQDAFNSLHKLASSIAGVAV